MALIAPSYSRYERRKGARMWVAAALGYPVRRNFPMATPAHCPACSDPVGDRARFCASCGAVLDASSAPTGTAPRPRTPASGAHRPPSSGHAGTPSRIRASSAPVDGSRFVPGTLLLDRYRVIELLGKGGMGEVYRAEDLVLGQSVALKFLRGLGDDADRLDRFYNEARMAREVTHPAVCRVHDVGQVDGETFLSMEYVDGEDLASLLRRIGRLPEDKALQIARQLCAGVATAHDKGVLHRDLKPQNVMIDGHGNVRITDFGLAGLAGTIQGDDVRSGTPGYMSPEQLAGREVSAKSDIFAIGLILYELFTGTRAYPGRMPGEVRKQHDEPLRPPSSVVDDVDAAVDAPVLRCLDQDPAQRPPSARAVAALLPGGDPLAAALMAGETPSPDMVAASARAEAVRPEIAWTCVAAAAACALVTLVVQPRLQLFPRLPDTRPPVALEDRARDFLRRIGSTDPAADRARGIVADNEYFRWAGPKDHSPTRWEKLGTGDPPVLSFWYRQGPRPLIPTGNSSFVRWTDPPWLVSAMAGVRVDFSGRLLEFYAVTPQLETAGEPAAAPEPDWRPLFAEAGLDPAQFKPVTSLWTPPFFCDRRQAWEGTYARRPEIPLRVEAAAYRGRPVYFRLVSPWTRAERMQPFTRTASQEANQIIFTVLLSLLLAVGGWMAWRNLRLGRGDRRGAARLAATLVVASAAIWALSGHHVRDRDGFMTLMARELGSSLLFAFVLWVFYLALEPYVRRFWPRTIVSWTRLLARGPNDPVVARDVLFGLVWGGGVAVLIFSTAALSPWWGQPEPVPSNGSNLAFALAPRYTAAAILSLFFNGLVLAMGSLLLLLLLKLLLRSERAAAWLVVAILTVIQALPIASGEGSPWITGAVAFVIMATFTLLLRRAGVVAAITAIVFANLLLSFPLTLDLEAWYSGTTVLCVAFGAALGVYAFRTSRRAAVPAAGR
jgi:serine/threonine-protein kinase